MDYSRHLNPSSIPPTQPLNNRQVANDGGGYSFAVDTWTQVRRFLILGAEGGTYYVGERKLVMRNIKSIEEAIKEDPKRLVEMIVEVSDKGLAPKNDAALFTLALVAGSKDPKTRKLAYDNLYKVARTSTHLFDFMQAVKTTRGSSMGLRKALANWYMRLKPENLELQVIKYRQRNGWTHRDVLRQAHVKPWSKHAGDVFNYVVNRDAGKEYYIPEEGLPVIQAFEQVSKLKDPKEVARFLKKDTNRLPWEALDTGVLKSADVWKALLPSMGYTALLRNLGRMSALGIGAVGGALNEDLQYICTRLTDPVFVSKSRVHPFAILLALKVYGQGRGDKGSLTWTPATAIVDALEKAFYLASKNVEPTGQRYLIGLDISGSMGYTMAAGSPITCREAGAALATIIKRTEPWCETLGFSHTLVNLGLGTTETVRDFVQRTSNLPFGATDASLTIEYALTHKIKVDVFVLITDNDVNTGRRHPAAALQEYRRRVNPNAKIAILGMASNSFTVADPQDAGMIDIAGLDASMPQILATFARGYK
jgi:60 kDa SS-A/Ro ribonucleoprotein